MDKATPTLENKKKQIKNALIKKFGIDKKTIIDETIKTHEQNLLADNIQKAIEAEIKRKLKEPEKIKEPNNSTNNVNKKLENLHKKLNIYNIDKPKQPDNMTRTYQSERVVVNKTNYDSLYRDYIGYIVDMYVKNNTIKKNDAQNLNGKSISNKLNIDKFNGIVKYDPSGINKVARMSLSTKNLNSGLKSTRLFTESSVSVKEGKSDAKNSIKGKNVEKKGKGSLKDDEKIVDAKQSSIKKINIKTITKNDSKELKKPDKALIKKTPNLTSKKNTNFSTVQNDNCQEGLNNLTLISVTQPRKYMTKLEKFYSELLTEIKEDNEKGEEADMHEYIIGYGKSN